MIALFGADLRWHGATLFVASQQTLMGLSVASLIEPFFLVPLNGATTELEQQFIKRSANDL